MPETARQRIVTLLDGASSSGAPSGNSGISLEDLRDPATGKMPEMATLAVRGKNTGSAASVTGRLWFKYPGATQWAPAGTGTGTSKGQLNDGSAMDEQLDNEIHHVALGGS